LIVSEKQQTRKMAFAAELFYDEGVVMPAAKTESYRKESSKPRQATVFIQTPLSEVDTQDLKLSNPSNQKPKKSTEPNLVSLGKMNVKTGEFTSRFVGLQCRPTVEWLSSDPKHQSPHQFQIRVSMASPHHDQFYELYTVYDSEKSDNNISASDKIEMGCMILIPRTAPSNAVVCVELYTTRFNSTGQLCQYEVGTTVNLTVGDLVQAMNRKTRKQLALEHLALKTNYFNDKSTSSAMDRKEVQSKMKSLISKLDKMAPSGNEDEDDVGQHQRHGSAAAASMKGSEDKFSEFTPTAADTKFEIPQPAQTVRCGIFNVMGHPQAVVSLRGIKCISKDPRITLLPPSKDEFESIVYPGQGHLYTKEMWTKTLDWMDKYLKSAK